MKRFKLLRRPYKGESWKIFELVGGEWKFHSSYTHYCFMAEALKTLNGS